MAFGRWQETQSEGSALTLRLDRPEGLAEGPKRFELCWMFAKEEKVSGFLQCAVFLLQSLRFLQSRMGCTSKGRGL